ncbi:MAG: GNAT family N-acetyltransferase [Actinomycetales bacterium]
MTTFAASWVRAAHADAWERQGLLRRPLGGDAARLPGVRLMASGLPHPQWNGGDVVDPAAVDLPTVAEWFAERGVPWGLRVPAAAPWPHGRLLFRQRLMGLVAPDFVPAPAATRSLTPESRTPPTRLRIRGAGPADLAEVLAVAAAAFEEDPTVERPWLEPHLSAAGVTVALAELDGRAVGTAYSLRSDGEAGPALYLGGVGVLPDARRQGVAAAMSSWLLARGFADGVQLAHLHPDTDTAARIYARLGFVEVDGFDVYVDCA